MGLAVDERLRQTHQFGLVADIPPATELMFGHPLTDVGTPRQISVIPLHARGVEFLAEPQLKVFEEPTGLNVLHQSSGDFPNRCCFHADARSEEHTSELQSRENLVCRLL